MNALRINTVHFLILVNRLILVILIHSTLGDFCQAQLNTLSNPEDEQTVKSHTHKINLKPFIFPGLLMSGGTVLNKSKWLSLDLNIKQERDENFPRFRNRADDYLQFAPVLAGYMFGIIKNKNQLWMYTKRLCMSEMMVGFFVPRLKTLSRVTNPDSESYNAFPSGHTAQAFAAATLFCDHFANHKPLLIGLTYTTATAVGCLRILNNKHWATDVIAGAGFGVFSAKVSEAVFNDKPTKQ
jgi:membrane-associated phospholipid phosphatase